MSSQNDLQAEIMTSLGNTPRALTQVKGGVEGIDKATKGANKSLRDFAGEATRGLGDVGHTAKETTHALRGIGPAARVIHEIFGHADMKEGFGRIAVTAGLAGLAFETVHKIMEKLAEDTKASVEITQKYLEVLEKVHETEKGQAERGAGGADAQRKLAAAGGEDAVKHAQGLAELGFVSPGEAAAGTTDIYNRFKDPRKRNAAMAAAQAAAYVGVPFDQAAKGIPTGMDLSDNEFRQRQVARIFAQHTGFRGDQVAHYQDAYDSVSKDRYLDATDAGRGTNARIGGIERDRAAERFAGDRRGALAEASDPTSAGNLAIYHETVKQSQLLERIAKSLDQQARDPNNNLAARIAAALQGIFADQKLYNFQKNNAAGLGLPTTDAGQPFGTTDASPSIPGYPGGP